MSIPKYYIEAVRVGFIYRTSVLLEEMGKKSCEYWKDAELSEEEIAFLKLKLPPGTLTIKKKDV